MCIREKFEFPLITLVKIDFPINYARRVQSSVLHLLQPCVKIYVLVAKPLLVIRKRYRFFRISS